MTAAKNIPFICINCIARCKRTNGADALDALGACAGGASVSKGTLRVTFWGAVAMAITAGVGAYFGAVV